MRESARRIRVDLAYDGTDFAGWQVQPGLRTVQGALEHALTRLAGGRPVRVRGAGRTDSGVHARAQVADFELDTRLDDRGLAHALRSILPPDVRVLRASTVDAGFDARRSALRKTYVYRLDRTLHGDPFRIRYALHYPHPLDEAAIGEALAVLPATRDWSSFTGAASEAENHVRTIYEARGETLPGEEYRFSFTADGFLNHMVRNLVGTLLDIGRGRCDASSLPEILEARDRARAGKTAPAHGLCLGEVVYPGAADVARSGPE